MEPICYFSTSNLSVPALSPDRKLIAFCTVDGIGLFDVAQQDVLCSQATPAKLLLATLAFSPSGKRLACTTQGNAWIWNTATGSLEQTIPLTGLVITAPVEFPDETAILASRHYLIDVASQLKLWTYDGAEFSRSAGGWTFFGVTDGDKKPGSLIASRLPHPAAIDQLKKSQNDPSLWILKSGMTVKLNVAGINDASQRDKVQQSLTKSLRTNGCQVGPNGSVEVVAATEGPAEETVSFIARGTYKMQKYTARVKIVYQGQTVWETAGSNVPFGMFLKQGETIEGALREREKPDFTWFDRVELPKMIQKPSGGQGRGSQTVGQSKLTTAGLK